MMAVDAWPSPEVPYILKRTSRDKYQTLDMDFSPPPPRESEGGGSKGSSGMASVQGDGMEGTRQARMIGVRV